MSAVPVELKRIGNNFNQIAKAVHEGNQNNSPELIGVSEELKGIWQLLKQLIQKPEET
jgi:hypothetical protein